LVVARNQLNGTNQLFGMRIIQQERVSLRGLVSESAAARLFPRKMLIENDNFVPGARQLLAAHCSRRSSADNRYLGHGSTSVFLETSWNGRTLRRAGRSLGQNRRSV